MPVGSASNILSMIVSDENGVATDVSNTTQNLASNGDAMNLIPLLSISYEKETGQMNMENSNHSTVTTWKEGEILTWCISYFLFMNDNGTCVG